MLGPVLLCGNDHVLLDTRKMLLTHAGFIASICSENDRASMPQDPGIALAVMGHSMPHKQQIETAERVCAKWPDARILFLMSTSARLTKLSPKEYQCGSAEPAQLIHACRHILGAE